MFASFLLFLCPFLTSQAEVVLGGDRETKVIQATAIPCPSPQGTGSLLTSTRLVFLNLRCDRVENM